MFHYYFPRISFKNENICNLFKHHSINPPDNSLFLHKSQNDGVCLIYNSLQINDSDFFNNSILGYIEYMIDGHNIRIIKLGFNSQTILICSMIKLLRDIVENHNSMVISFSNELRSNKYVSFILDILNLSNEFTIIDKDFSPSINQFIEFKKPDTDVKNVQTETITTNIKPTTTFSTNETKNNISFQEQPKNKTINFGTQSTSFGAFNKPQTSTQSTPTQSTPTQKVSFGAFNKPQQEQKVSFGAFNKPQQEQKVSFGAFNKPQQEQKVSFGAFNKPQQEQKVSFGAFNKPQQEQKVSFGAFSYNNPKKIKGFNN